MEEVQPKRDAETVCLLCVQLSPRGQRAAPLTVVSSVPTAGAPRAAAAEALARAVRAARFASGAAWR